MLKVGLISDTHGYLDPIIFEYFKDVDEIWHAGDIGSIDVLKKLRDFKPTKVVFGNIDEPKIRYETDELLVFDTQGLKVLMIHIGATPPSYTPKLRKLIKIHSPNLFICGHTHILRVVKDNAKLVYINPGAAGHHGSHHTRTIMLMTLEDGRISHLEVKELGKR